MSKLSDLPLTDCESSEEVDTLLQKELNFTLKQCSEALSKSLMEKAEELVPEMMNLAPNGDYSKMTEDPQEIMFFLKEEAVKLENWKLQFIDIKKDSQLMELVFFNTSVDDGDSVKGFVFVGASGKIRHAFVQVN